MNYGDTLTPYRHRSQTGINQHLDDPLLAQLTNPFAKKPSFPIVFGSEQRKPAQPTCDQKKLCRTVVESSEDNFGLARSAREPWLITTEPEHDYEKVKSLLLRSEIRWELECLELKWKPAASR